MLVFNYSFILLSAVLSLGLAMPDFSHKKCTLERSYTKNTGTCFLEPECEKKCKDETRTVCNPYQENECRKESVPSCRIVNEQKCETAYETKVEDKCTRTTEEVCKHVTRTQCSTAYENKCSTM